MLLTLKPIVGLTLAPLAAVVFFAAQTALSQPTPSQPTPSQPPGSARETAERTRPKDKVLFLDRFLSQFKVTIVTRPVTWTSAIGEHRGLLVRPESNEQLPGVLLIANEQSNEFFVQAARDLSGIGYVVLVVEIDPRRTKASPGQAPSENEKLCEQERVLAQLSAAVRWLRRRPDVFPDKLGALGWGGSAPTALKLAAAQRLEGAVLVDAALPLLLDAPLSVELRNTAVLVAQGTADQAAAHRKALAQFKGTLTAAKIGNRVVEFKTAKPGFMDSRSREAFDEKSADQAWFEIYEFLGKYVEDADVTTAFTPPGRPHDARPAHSVASIADLMRAVNGLRGVYPDLVRSLNEPPRGEKDWNLVRARAALLAETGVLLDERTPSRGTPASWRHHVAPYREAASALANSANRRSFFEARQALDRLKTSCEKCHLEHR